MVQRRIARFISEQRALRAAGEDWRGAKREGSSAATLVLASFGALREDMPRVLTDVWPTVESRRTRGGFSGISDMPTAASPGVSRCCSVRRLSNAVRFLGSQWPAKGESGRGRSICTDMLVRARACPWPLLLQARLPSQLRNRPSGLTLGALGVDARACGARTRGGPDRQRQTDAAGHLGFPALECRP